MISPARSFGAYQGVAAACHSTEGTPAMPGRTWLCMTKSSLVLVAELDQADAVGPEVVEEAVERPIDLRTDLRGGEAREAGREIRQQRHEGGTRGHGLAG